MRIEISYKFITGFLLVVASVVFMDILVPYLGVRQELQQLVSTGSAIAVGLILGVSFSKVFTTNIQQVNAGANRLSHGDLTSGIEIKQPLFADETIELAEAINNVICNLRELVNHIRSTSECIASSAHQLSFATIEINQSSQNVTSSFEQIAQGAMNQAEMVEKSSRLSHEVALKAKQVATAAHELAVSADLTTKAAYNGGEKAELTTTILKKILNEIETNEQRITAFSAQLHKVGKFTEIISNIANKTNLLSLNATIEAARAGEYGHGFAALAEEIRKLSDSTYNSTSEITELVETIREENRIILSSMTAIVARMDEGHLALDVSSRAFGEIIQNAASTLNKATGIAELSQQQSEGVCGIVMAIDEISRVVTDNAVATEQASATTAAQASSMNEIALSAKHLNSLAVDLMQVVMRFQLDVSAAPSSDQILTLDKSLT